MAKDKKRKAGDVAIINDAGLSEASLRAVLQYANMYTDLPQQQRYTLFKSDEAAGGELKPAGSISMRDLRRYS